MKTLLLDCSPKTRLSTSSYLLSHLSIQLSGEKEKIKLIPKNYSKIFDAMQQVENVVLALPMYVDGVPASILKFFDYVLDRCKDTPLSSIKIYAIVNCGFYEGVQTKVCHSIIENWCRRCGVQYMGGIGQGAGEMIGVIRFVNPFIAVFVSLIQFIINAIILADNFTFAEALRRVGFINISINIALYFIFNIFMYIAISKLAKAIRRKASMPIVYSTVFCPRFLFVIFADLFWIVKALLRGVPIWQLTEKPAEKRQM